MKTPKHYRLRSALWGIARMKDGRDNHPWWKPSQYIRFLKEYKRLLDWEKAGEPPLSRTEIAEELRVEREAMGLKSRLAPGSATNRNAVLAKRAAMGIRDWNVPVPEAEKYGFVAGRAYADNEKNDFGYTVGGILRADKKELARVRKSVAAKRKRKAK